MISEKKSKLKRISIIIISVLFFFSAISMAVTKVIYDSIFARYDAPANIPEELSSLVEQRSVHQFRSGYNQLTGYYYPAETAENGLIVLVPGFHAGGDNYLWQISSLLEYGWSVFTFDPTGSFRSEGQNQVGFSQSVLDLEAALKYVEKSQNFGYNNLVLMGHSRGGYAVCCALAQETDVDAVVSINGINSAMSGVMQSSVDTVGPIAYGNYGFLWLYQAMIFGDDVLNCQADNAISGSDVPVLVIHGTQDQEIPMDDDCAVISQKDQITSDQVEYRLYPAGHTDLLYDSDGTANDLLMQDIHEFLIRTLNKTNTAG